MRVCIIVQVCGNEAYLDIIFESAGDELQQAYVSIL